MTRIQIDDSNNKGKALLAYLRTLDFVKVEKDESLLTAKQLKILDERRKSHLSGESKSSSWDEVKNALGKNRLT